MSKRYGMIYLKSTNVHLVKDMGMIPFKLYEKYGYDSSLITFKNGEYTFQNDVVKGLKLEFVKNRFNSYALDGSIYLLKNSKNYDILQMFHVTLSSFCYAYIYKFLNKEGKLYLKLDCSHLLPERISNLNKIGKVFLKKFFNKFDLITVEQEKIYKDLINQLPYLKDKLKILPNGVDFKLLDSLNISYDYSVKENIILSTARIGAEEKNTMMLLEAFKNIPVEIRKGWKLRLVGPIEDGFLDLYKKFLNENSGVEDSIELVGNVDDREALFNEYKKAKIFSLTSDFESFGISFIEAAALGDIIVSTDVGIAYEIVNKSGGILVKPGDEKALTEGLINYMTCRNLKEISHKTYSEAVNKFDWDNIIDRLNEHLKSIL